MALRRRGGDHMAAGVWPGFVDVMTAMLLVFTFVLSIFMVTQYFLRQTIVGQEEQIFDRDSTIRDLSSRLDSLSDLLSLERREKADLQTREDELLASLQILRRDNNDLTANVEATNAALAARTAEFDQSRLELEREIAERLALQALAQDLRAERETLVGALDTVNAELSEEERRRLVEAAAAERLRAELAQSQTELTALTLELDARRAEAEETLTLLAAAEAARADLRKSESDAAGDLTRAEALLAVANAALQQEEAASAEDRRAIALLNEQTRALREQLAQLQALLGSSEAEIADQEAALANLGERLNVAIAERNQALAAQVDELSNFRSEFFGRVREALRGRDGIQIAGDRFVFQSEVLFAPASATLDAGGRAELSRFAAVLRGIAAEIPGDVNWILRIDGHTDSRPLNASRSRYANNWELSQARALSVATFLIDNEGISPERLAPTGFGEFQPIASGTSPEAYARNRRIELKLTER